MKFLLSLLFICALSSPALANDVVLTTKNTCTLDESVNDDSMFVLEKCLIDKVITRGKKNYKIYLVLNSPGGSIYSGLRFIDFAKNIKNLETVTIYSASMAAAIVEHLPGKRHILSSGIVMFHRAKGTISGQFGNGELESRLKLWQKIVKKSEENQAKRIGITLKSFRKKIKDEWWLYGDDAVKNNVVDSVSNVKCSFKLANTFRKKKIKTFFGIRTIEVSACPLVN